MSETRTYQGHVYTRNGPGEPWTITGPAPSAPQTFGTPDPYRSTREQQEQTLRAQSIAKNATDIAKSDKPAAPSGFRWSADGKTLEFIPGGPEDPKNKATRFKALREGDGTKLDSAVTSYGDFKRLNGGFVDDYGGNLFGGLENSAQNIAGIGTPGQAQWWADFRSTDNVIRNGLYGASLTDGEKQAYNETTIQPSMSAATIRANLARRQEILRQAISRKVGRFRAGGYNPEEIDAATGEYGQDFAPDFGKRKQGELPAAVPGIAPPTGGGAAPFAGPGPVPDLGASGATGQNVIGTGQNAVANPEGEALYKEYLGLWGAKADDATIRKWSQEVYGKVNPDVEAALTARRQGKKINFYPGDGLLTKNVDADGSRNALDGVVADASASPLGTFAVNAGNAAGAGLPQYLAGKMGGNRDLTDIRFDTMNARNPNAAALGQLTGGAVGAGAAELGALRAAAAFGRGAQWAPRIADTAYGAVSGATGNADNPLLGAGLGGALGGIGGAAGRSVARGAGNAFRGVQNEAVRELSGRGIPMTAGQILGNSGRIGTAIKGVEDRLSGIPVVGDMINARRAEGIAGFNRAAFDEALKPIAARGSGQIGETGIQDAQDAVGGAYRTALGGRSATIDPQFGSDEASILSRAGAIPRVGPEVSDGLDNITKPYFSPSGDMSGENLQATLRDIGKFGRGYKADPLASRVQGATNDLQSAVTGMFERQAPDVIPQFRAANEAYGNLSTLEDAVLKGVNTDGTFLPSQLNLASRTNAINYGGKKAAAAGSRPFADLARAGQQVLPSKVPDSGTAGRLAALALPGLLGSGGAGVDYATGGSGAGATGLTLGALLAAGGTKRAQRLLQTVLLDRPDALIRVGEKINRRQALGGIFGAPILLQSQR